MAKKKDALLVEDSTEESSVVVLLDERGKALTEEEARVEEEKLNMMMTSFFMNNLPQMQSAFEEEDEEAIIATVDEQGKVIEEKKQKVKVATNEQLSISCDKQLSIFEQSLLKGVIRAHMSKMTKAYASILEVEEDFYSLTEGFGLFNNFSDAYRREKNELQSLLFSENVSLDKLKNENLKRILERDLEELANNLVSVISAFAE